MTLTTIAEEAPPRRGAPPPVPGPRSRRLSAGHLVMLVAALVAVLANYAALRAGDDSIRVAVVGTTLRAGDTVTAGALAFADARVDDAVRAGLLGPEDLAAVEGWVATTALEPGDLLRRSDLGPPSAPAAQRAMSVPIDPEHAVAGDLRAGDRVDVIEVDGRVATYLVTDAEVLAVPGAEGAGGALGGLRAYSVTLAVDDATALALAVAIRGGAIEVVRSTGSAAATVERLDRTAAPAGGGSDGGAEGAGAGAGAEGDRDGGPTGGERADG